MRGTNSWISEIVTPKLSVNVEETEVIQQNLYLCIIVKMPASLHRLIWLLPLFSHCQAAYSLFKLQKFLQWHVHVVWDFRPWDVITKVTYFLMVQILRTLQVEHDLETCQRPEFWSYGRLKGPKIENEALRNNVLSSLHPMDENIRRHDSLDMNKVNVADWRNEANKRLPVERSGSGSWLLVTS